MFIRQALITSALLAVLSHTSQAQFGGLNTTLKPETATEFEAYGKQVEAELNARWNGKGSFLQIDDDAEARQKVLEGELYVHTELQKSPRPISDGLIHDWYGAMYIPNTTMAKVLSVLQDYDHHSAIYPQVVRSKLIKHEGNDLVGYWRLEQKGQILPAVFDVTTVSHYRPIGSDKWVSISHADNIQTVEKSKILPAGEGTGFMWKLHSYWALQQVGNGIMAECRTVSLSRGVPGTLAWMIRPLLNSIPRDTMNSTLSNTRKASGD